MTALHGEVDSETGSKCSRLARREIHSHISTQHVALDCWMDKEGNGRCEISDHKTGEVTGAFNIKYGRVYQWTGESEMRPLPSELIHAPVGDRGPWSLSSSQYWEPKKRRK